MPTSQLGWFKHSAPAYSSLPSLLNPVNEWLDPKEMSSPKRTTSRAASHEKDLEAFGGDGSPYPSEDPGCRLFSLDLLKLGVSVRVRERERGRDAVGRRGGGRRSIDAGRWRRGELGRCEARLGLKGTESAPRISGGRKQAGRATWFACL